MNPAMSTVAVKSKVRISLGIIVGLIVALGLTGTAWGFLKYSKSPEAYILESFIKLSEAKTMAYEGSIEASANISEPESWLALALSKKAATPAVENTTNYAVKVSLAGESDLRDETNPASSLDIGALLKKDGVAEPEFKLNVINKDKIYYVRVPTIPADEAYNAYADFANTWIHFDYSALSEEFSTFMEEESELDATTPEQKKNTEKIIESLKRTVALNPPIKVTKTFRNEKIAGNDVRHYTFTLNPQNIEKIMKELAAHSEETGVYPEDIEEVNEQLTKISSFTGEIWLDKTNNYPYKLNVTVKAKDEEEMRNGTLSLSLTMKNFNRNINISKPPKSISFEEVLTKIFEQYQSDYDYSDEVFELEAPVDSDGDTISDSEESFWGTNPTKKDTDGDGYNDDVEIRSGHDPLKR